MFRVRSVSMCLCPHLSGNSYSGMTFLERAVMINTLPRASFTSGRLKTKLYRATRVESTYTYRKRDSFCAGQTSYEERLWRPHWIHPVILEGSTTIRWYERATHPSVSRPPDVSPETPATARARCARADMDRLCTLWGSRLPPNAPGCAVKSSRPSSCGLPEASPGQTHEGILSQTGCTTTAVCCPPPPTQTKVMFSINTGRY